MVEGSFPGGAEFDDKTIVDDDLGRKRVAPNTFLIGDFENNSSGDWTLDADVGIADANGGAEGSTYYMRHYANSVTTVSATRTEDLTEAEELRVYLKIGSDDISPGTSNDKYQVFVGGTKEVEISGGTVGDWSNEYVIDLSGYTGDNQIEIRLDNNSGNTTRFGADKIRLVKQTIATEEADGAGGTA